MLNGFDIKLPFLSPVIKVVCRKDKQERAEGQSGDHDSHAQPGASGFLGGSGGAARGDQEARPR